MFPTTSTTQIVKPVPLQHGDPNQSNLGAPDLGNVVVALRTSMFNEVLKSLRAALFRW